MSYGVSATDLFRRAATYVDKILKGARPAELPIEQPSRFEFIINLQAAKAIGMSIPPVVLSRAGECNDYLMKSLDRNTTGRSACACSSKNLRDARSSITSRSRIN